MMKMFLDAEAANKALDDSLGRQAALELALRMAVRLCHLRRSGFCYMECRGMILCDAKDMKILTWAELTSEFKRLLKPDSALYKAGPTENKGRSRYEPEEDSFEKEKDRIMNGAKARRLNPYDKPWW